MSTIPPEVADILRPLLPDLAAETIREIAAEVPAYSRPLEGHLGVTLRYGTERALRRFVDTIEYPEEVSDRDRRTYVELGRLEMRQGRTLNALLAAYRVGAQVAWRRFVEAGEQAQLQPATLYRLGEAIFAYIDAISGESIEGYAAEQSAGAGERQRRRARLVALLAADPPPARDVLRTAASRAAWTPPARIAALIVDGAEADSIASRLGPGTVAAVLDGAEADSVTGEAGGPAGHVLAFVPDADGPGRLKQLQVAVGSTPAALGPTVALGDAARSAERARRALELRASGALPGEGLVVAEEHATALLLHADQRLASEFAAARLAALQTLRPAVRARLTATLEVWLDHQGRIDETARELAVHPQTVRYRLAQLREAFGTALDDADARFELSVALRVLGRTSRA